MSDPENPLNEFRTFSYYFIFGVAKSTQEAIRFAKESNDTSAFESDAGKKILLNGAKDAHLIIKSVEINSILHPSGAYTGESFFHTMNMEGKIVIQEPLGIRFYEQLRDAAKDFKTETTNMVFFIKPIFVGYKPDSRSSTILETKPYIFLITQLTSIVDEGGAIYNLETFGIVNGAGKLPQFQSVAGGFNLTIEKSETKLPDAIKKLEESLNEHFNKKCKINKEKLDESGMRPGFDANKIKIEYIFNLDPEYNDEYIVGTNIDETLKEISTEKHIIHQGPSAGIEELIRKIMNSCERVVNERDLKPPDITEGFTYKIHSSLDIDVGKIILNFYIHKYKMEFVPIESKKYPEPGFILKFDYIYTGKNIDIKEFQINMKLGALFFHNTYTTNNLHLNESEERGAQKAASSAQTGTAGIPVDEIDGGDPPIQGCFGTSSPVIDNEARNNPNPVSTASYYNMLKRFSALENLGIDVVIKGNPNLMDSTVLVPDDLDFNSSIDTTGKPLYIYMDIKFPENHAKPRENFTTFWYDGPYYILSIKNNFDENGDFTQTIHMYAMHTDYSGDIPAKDGGGGSAGGGGGGGSAGGGGAASSAASGGSTGGGGGGGGGSTGGGGGDSTGGSSAGGGPLTGPGYIGAGGILTDGFDAINEGYSSEGLTPNNVKTGEPFRQQQMINKINPQLNNLEKLNYKLDNLKDEMEDLTSMISGFKAVGTGVTREGGDVLSLISKEIERIGSVIYNVEEEIAAIEKVKKQTQKFITMAGDKPIELAQALNEEYKLKQRLNIHPDNIINVINNTAPVLSPAWKSLNDLLNMINGKLNELNSMFNNIRSTFEQIVNLPANLMNQAINYKNQMINQAKGLKNQVTSIPSNVKNQVTNQVSQVKNQATGLKNQVTSIPSSIKNIIK
jgi:hypothetical protein